MPVSTLVPQIDQALNGFIQQRDTILNNRNLSGEGKKAAVNAFFEQTVPIMEQLATRLWGAIETRPMGDFMLSPNGAAWVEMNVGERAIAEARESAERAGIQPEWVQHNMTRVKAALATIAHPEEFEKLYNSSSQQLKEAMQDYGGAILNQSGIEWSRIRKQLEAARAARLDTPAVRSAQQTINQLIANLEQGIAVTRRVADTFGQGSYYLGNVLNGVFFERRYVTTGVNERGFEVEIKPRSWGLGVKLNPQSTLDDREVNSGNWLNPEADTVSKDILRRSYFG